jgi:signal transduction histidine kinase
VSAEHPATPALARLRQARAQQETVQRWIRLMSPVLFGFFCAVTAFGTHPVPGLAGRALVVSAGLGGFALGALGVSGTLRRQGRLHLAFVIVLVASPVALMWAQPRGPGSAGVFFGVLVFARRLSGRAAVWVPAVALVSLVLIAEVTSRGNNVGVMIILGCLYVMIFLANRLGEANVQAQQLLIDLGHSRAGESRAAGLAERQRLAREMHDVLAHSLSGLMLQLEAARMLAAEDPADARLPAAIDRAHHLGHTGLEEASRAIGMLRGDELPGPERLAGLAAQFQENRGIPCRLTVSGAERKLGSQARLAVYRVAQEALTNITKHALPDLVQLHLAYQPRAIRLTVEDFTTSNSTRPPPPADDSGYGLTGMRERAELLGGTLTTQMTCTGFRVELEVPA